MHPLLQRHLRSAGVEGDAVPTTDAWATLLAHVEAAYDGADRQRYIDEQSITVCSQEIQELQARLSRERDRLSAMVSSMGDALCVVKFDGTIDFANPAAEQLLGSPPDGLNGRDLVDIVSGRWPREKERRTAMLKLATCIARGQSCRFDDARFATCDGVMFPVSFVGTPILHAGVPQGTVIIFRDMTARRATEDALRESESRFRAIFASAGMGIVRVWLNGEIAECNPAYGEMFGYAPAELVGRSLTDLVHPSERAAFRGVLDSCRESSRPTAATEARRLHRDGATVWIVASSSLVRSESGEPLFFINVVENITQRKALEVELRHAHKLESVGRLAAGVAHEINTPIQFIGDNVHFLDTSFKQLFELNAEKDALLAAASAELAEKAASLSEKTDLAYLIEEVPRAIAQSIEGISHVARIVQAMKAFSHPDQGDHQCAVDLNAALESSLTVARSELKHVADVHTELGDLPLVPCYAGDLNQVFLNLLVNAAHAIGDVVATTGGRGQISVRTWVEGDAAVVAIGDTGGGIPEAIRRRVFDPFFTTKEVGKGTGQGLALAHGVVVDKHQGKLTFDSEPGKGTVFYVRLPLAGATVEAAA